MIIGVDFDGTCVYHDFPRIGADIGAAPVIKELIDNGHEIVLTTMRDNNSELAYDGNDPYIHPYGGNYLDEAVEWFSDNGLKLSGVQHHPSQHDWTSSPKAYCHILIDDVALGVPLKVDTSMGNRPFVDWIRVREILVSRGVIRE